MTAAARARAFADVEGAYVGFRDLLVMLPAEKYAETVAGTWDLASILAHMAGWYRELAPEFGRIVGGNPTSPGAWADFDAWNARFAAASKPGANALDDFDMAFHEFYAAAKEIPDEHWGTGDSGEPLPVEALFRELAIAHTAEHRAEIETWIGR